MKFMQLSNSTTGNYCCGCSFQVESQPAQAEQDAQVTDDVVQPAKSSSKSSLKSKVSKASLKSVKNETTAEVLISTISEIFSLIILTYLYELQPIQVVTDAQIKDGVVQPPKSSDKSSVKSKSSKTSLKSAPGESAKGEMSPEVHRSVLYA